MHINEITICNGFLYFTQFKFYDQFTLFLNIVYICISPHLYILNYHKYE